MDGARAGTALFGTGELFGELLVPGFYLGLEVFGSLVFRHSPEHLLEQGEALHPGSYREHLGPCKDGTARVFRLGAVSGGLMETKDAKIATKRTPDGWICEWAYPKALVSPLDLRPGGRFRLSLFFFDNDDSKVPFTRGGSGGLIFGGFNSNVKVDTLKWPEFVLVE